MPGSLRCHAHPLHCYCPFPPSVPGEVHAAKDYGLLCDLAAHEDVVGLAAPHQVRHGCSAKLSPAA